MRKKRMEKLIFYMATTGHMYLVFRKDAWSEDLQFLSYFCGPFSIAEWWVMEHPVLLEEAAQATESAF